MHRAETVEIHRALNQRVSSIMPFSCTKYPGAIQVLRADGIYAVKNLNIETGKYEMAYTIPFDRTTPKFKTINAAAINPIDGIAYGVVHLNPEGNTPTSGYLVRFDENAVEFVAILTEFSAAGSFSSKGTFYYRTDEGAFAIRDVANLVGDTNPWNVQAQLHDAKAIEVPGLDRYTFGNDLVAYVGDLEGVGTEDEYVVSLKKKKLAIFKDAGNKSKYWLINFEGAGKSDDWGAGWNFRGSVYFSSNLGLGV